MLSRPLARPLLLAVLLTSTALGCGSEGAQGPQGPQGESGPLGPKGDVGSIGPRGDVGPAGAEGPAGVAGPMGPQGPQGDVGPVGPMGPIGPQGVVGPQGLKGATGATGATGPAGAQGPTGATGVQGPVGVAGPQGDPATSLLPNAGVLYFVETAGTLGSGNTATLSVSCNQPNDVLLFGGCDAEPNASILFATNRPILTKPEGWTCTGTGIGATTSMHVFARCIAAP